MKLSKNEKGLKTMFSKKELNIKIAQIFFEMADILELKQIKWKPYPIPKIQELLLKLEGFRYAMSLELNMGGLLPH